jgi:hypothetical protein
MKNEKKIEKRKKKEINCTEAENVSEHRRCRGTPGIGHPPLQVEPGRGEVLEEEVLHGRLELFANAQKHLKFV